MLTYSFYYISGMSGLKKYYVNRKIIGYSYLMFNTISLKNRNVPRFIKTGCLNKKYNIVCM